MALNTASALGISNSLTGKFATAARNTPVFYPKVCNIIPSNVRSEQYAMLGAMPKVQEWLGERQAQQLRASDYTLLNKLWESTLAIDRQDIEDDRLGLYDAAIAELASEAVQHPDKLFFEALVAGESAACYDGQFFYDTDHAWGDSGTQSNDLSSAAATGTNPTSAEFKTAFHAALMALLAFKNDRGEPFHRPVIQPGDKTGLLVVVPLTMLAAAQEAIQAVIIGNNSNVLVATAEIAASAYLTADKMYLFKTGGPLKPFVFQARTPLRTQIVGLTESIEKKEALFMTEARYNVGYGAWFNSVLTTFT